MATVDSYLTNLKNTMSAIDLRIGELDSVVNTYGSQLTNLGEMHEVLRTFIGDSENQHEFLVTLANELFAALDNAGTKCTGIQGDVSRLNSEIQRRQELIDRLSQEIDIIQQRAAAQLNKLNSIGANMLTNNNNLDAMVQNSVNLNNEVNVRKRKRESDTEDLVRKIRQRDELNARFQQLASERSDIAAMLQAVNTTLQQTPPPAQPPTSGPGSRGGPGSVAFAGVNPANIVSQPRRKK